MKIASDVPASPSLITTSETDKDDRGSSSVISASPTGSLIVALTAFERRTRKFSETPSYRPSPRTVTTIVRVKTPGAKSSVPATLA